MDNICRLCAKIAHNNCSLVHISDPNLSIESKLLQCCQITLAANKNLPQNVCNECVQCLDATYNFIERTLRVQENFNDELCFVKKEGNFDNDFHIEYYVEKDETQETLKCGSKRKRKSPIKHHSSDINNYIVPDNPNYIIQDKDDTKMSHWISIKLTDCLDTFTGVTNNDVTNELSNEVSNEITNKIYTDPNNIDLSAFVGPTIKFNSDELNHNYIHNYNEEPIDIIDDLDDDPDDPEYDPEHEKEDFNNDDDNSDSDSITYDENDDKLPTKDKQKNIKTENETLSNDEEKDENEEYDNNEPLNDNIYINLTTADKNRDGKINEIGLEKLNISSWNDYPWKCHECKLKFTNMENLIEHYKDIHQTDDVQYECGDCARIFITKYQTFIRHVIKRHRNHLKYCCELCGAFYWTQKLLLKHKYTHSKTERTFVCETCGKSFTNNNALQLHTKSHLPKELKNRFKCDICDKKFGTRPNLMAHKRIHTGIREYICEHCGKDFVQKGNLDNHMLTHVADRPYICGVCNKKFKTQLRLNNHESVHSGLKPHQCKVCRRKFREKGTLREHERIHSGVMPFACDFCDKRFRFKGVLTTHRRQHTGERPYSCVDCNHHFTNWPNYNKHMKRRHGINTSVTVRKPQTIPPSGMPALSKLNHIVPIVNNIGDEDIDNDNVQQHNQNITIDLLENHIVDNQMENHIDTQMEETKYTTMIQQQQSIPIITQNNEIENHIECHITDQMLEPKFTTMLQAAQSIPILTQNNELLNVAESTMHHQLHNSQMITNLPMQQIIHQSYNTSIVNYMPMSMPISTPVFYNIQTVDVDLIPNNN